MPCFDGIGPRAARRSACASGVVGAAAVPASGVTEIAVALQRSGQFGANAGGISVVTGRLKGEGCKAPVAAGPEHVTGRPSHIA